ncbi:hypothetical protein GPECTOR_1g353 [Gonium pectorale]|uniref:Apple domain-containing protein n=1 Tax=Gonium pectorale TaxID=33097 RepID=A0A150H2J3_GONPE|nr:hypothetical protein GPECTOR_1g353 [Gonium pectorale]|eukprot:KXZ56397.1 hypothetical protein GPECTOR_1g353 [Gonium pectorale]
MGVSKLVASSLLCAIFAAAARGAEPPNHLIAVANRDVEGSVVLDADSELHYTHTASACRDACVANSSLGCNLWVYCPVPGGCLSGGTYDWYKDLRRYRQCWLKYDRPPAVGAGRAGSWPRPKNSRDQATGWLSGTTDSNVTDGAGADQGYSRCTCQADYWSNGAHFKGVCASTDSGYGPSCPVNSDCRSPPNPSTEGCPQTQRCTVILDTDLDGQLLNDGEYTYTDAPEECCGACAAHKVTQAQQGGGGHPAREGIFRVCLLVLYLDAETQKRLLDEMGTAPDDATADEDEDELDFWDY